MFDPERVSRDPFLVLGWREGKEITCRRLAIDSELFEDIRTIAQDHLQILSEAEERRYEPSAALERGEEYFLVPKNVIPSRPSEDGEKPASLLNQLNSVADIETVTPRELEEKTIIFYAFVFQQDNLTSWLSFVRKINPMNFFRARRWWCTTEAGLKKLRASPTFAFDNTFDLVIDSDQIYATSEVALKQLFTEVNLSAINVDDYVSNFVATLPASIMMTEESQDQLAQLARRKTSFVSRVYALENRLREISQVTDFSAELIIEAIDDDDLGDDLIVDNEIVLESERHAQVFLDAIEGRFFRDGLTQHRRRADRISSR